MESSAVRKQKKSPKAAPYLHGARLAERRVRALELLDALLAHDTHVRLAETREGLTVQQARAGGGRAGDCARGAGSIGMAVNNRKVEVLRTLASTRLETISKSIHGYRFFGRINRCKINHILQ